MCWRERKKSSNRSRNGRTRQKQTRIIGRTHARNACPDDALTKLLIEKGIITDAEFKQKLLEERSFSRSHGCQLARIEGSRCRYLDHWRRNSNRLWNPFFYG